jgi:hypothetical protein
LRRPEDAFFVAARRGFAVRVRAAGRRVVRAGFCPLRRAVFLAINFSSSVRVAR